MGSNQSSDFHSPGFFEELHLCLEPVLRSSGLSVEAQLSSASSPPDPTLSGHRGQRLGGLGTGAHVPVHLCLLLPGPDLGNTRACKQDWPQQERQAILLPTDAKGRPPCSCRRGPERREYTFRHMSGSGSHTDPDWRTGILTRTRDWHAASLAGWHWPAPFPAPWDPRNACKEGQGSLCAR